MAVKIDGSPYSAKQFLPNIPYETSPVEAAKMDGKLCPKGQAGVQTLYDPYRLRTVLKRAGPRGSGRWQTISFDQAIDEIVGGGNLFGEGPVPGLKELYALRDPKVASDMAADVELIKKQQMTVEDFKKKYAANLGALIDPDHPDLGPKNNQFLFMPGRINRTRIHFANRFVKDAFGSVNSFEHTSICELSIFVNTSEMTRNLATGAGKNHFKPDFLNSEFVIFWGTGFAEANFGVTPMAELVTRGMTEGSLKLAVVDPRLSKSAGKAWRWLPVKPGADGALALGMIRWIIENGRYDKRYLENPNLDAAKKDGEPTAADATHLVRTDRMLLLRAEEIGLQVPAPAAGQPKLDSFVVMTPEGPRRHDQAEVGSLEVSTTIAGIPVKSVFTLLKERAMESTLDQYAAISGIPVSTIVEVAREFTGHGKKAAIDMYRGPAKHTNGFSTIQAINTLNILIGNADWKGGLADGGGGWDDLGGKEGQPFPLGKLHPNKTKAFGVTFSREGWRYEDSTLFQRDGGYPAKRQWFPFAFNMWQDLIPSAEAGYPYPIKVLWLHKATPAYSVPGAAEQLRILQDPRIIPLVIATDVVIGETSMYADYVFPDVSYLEQWASPGDVPQPATKSNPFRQPAAAPIPEIASVGGERMPISLEAQFLAIAQKLGLPGFGKDGFGPGVDFKRPEEYYLKVAANLAFGDKADGSDGVPAAGDEELDLFRKARRHLTPAVFDEAKWQQAVGQPLWRNVVYVLNRGGRFEHFSKVYDGNYMAHRFGGTFHLFLERVARQKNSVTGQAFDGLPRYAPPLFSTGQPVRDQEYPFQIITFKEILGSQSRTPGTYWSQLSLMPENFVLINRADARRLSLDEGDEVRLVSASLPEGILKLGNGLLREMIGKVKLIEGIRPGVIAVSQSFGHWAYGATEVQVDGVKVPGDPRRGKGLQINPLLRLDDHLKTGCLTDPIGGSASFYDTQVRILRV
ncbi:MAG: molybdopterin-dependent oxidoreductase [Chloroflexi bacterium]|nr:molybdopterin-dependent oxidoreductase [Chloroflexota bacterium]